MDRLVLWEGIRIDPYKDEPRTEELVHLDKTTVWFKTTYNSGILDSGVEPFSILVSSEGKAQQFPVKLGKFCRFIIEYSDNE